MKAKANHENGILSAVKIDCSADEIGFLSAFLQGIVASNRIPAKFELETYTLIALYDRHYKTLSIIKPRKMKLQPAEFIALERLLMAAPIKDEYAAVLRNDIIAGLASIAWPGRNPKQSYLQANGTN